MCRSLVVRACQRHLPFLQAAKARGVSELDDFNFAQIRTASGNDEVFEAAEACISTTGTTSNCSLLTYYNYATATSASSRRITSDTTTTEQHLNSQAGSILIKNNLRACADSDNEDGSARSNSEVENCASSLKNSTFGVLINDGRKDSTLRAMQRELAAERMVACMSTASGSTSSCLAQATVTQQQYAAHSVSVIDVADTMLVYRSKLFSIVWTSCDSANPSALSSCESSAETTAGKAGGLTRATDMETGFNAFRRSAEWWCSCREAGSDELQCEQTAADTYQSLAGDAGEWRDKDRNSCEALATALCSGDLTEIVRTGNVMSSAPVV